MWPCGRYCYPIDVAIAVDHMSLAAMAEGLGTCWIRVLVVVMLTLGYPAESPAARPRKKLDEIIVNDGWQN